MKFNIGDIIYNIEDHTHQLLITQLDLVCYKLYILADTSDEFLFIEYSDLVDDHFNLLTNVFRLDNNEVIKQIHTA